MFVQEAILTVTLEKIMSQNRFLVGPPRYIMELQDIIKSQRHAVPLVIMTGRDDLFVFGGSIYFVFHPCFTKTLSLINIFSNDQCKKITALN